MNGGGGDVVKPTAWLHVLQQLPMSMSFHAAATGLYAQDLFPDDFNNITTHLLSNNNKTDTVINTISNATTIISILEPTTTTIINDLIIDWRHPALAILMAVLCITTVAGNCLVVLAVCTKKYLRNPTGYLIVSLAFADLIVGLVVMPLNSLFEMTRHVWLLGK